MQRTIVEPADVSGGALADLKSWLGITRPNEDALLTNLLHMALEMCEGFTGQSPLSQLVEERVEISTGQSSLTSRPVASVSLVELVLHNGTRIALTASQFEAKIEAQGNVTLRQLEPLDGQAVAVTSRVGIGTTWDEVPAPLKQGIIRLCAHHYHDRDRPSDDRKTSSPPALVSALWRPWQALRLA